MPLTCYNYADMQELINPGKWSEEDVDKLIIQASSLSSAGEKIDFISRQFLDVPYEEETLKGSSDEPEVFIINLNGVDCFTLLDYVDAMRLAKSFSEFKDSLKKVRYQEGVVDFAHRNHFFINWRDYNANRVEDITAGIGNSIRIDKQLNDRGGGTLFLPGVVCSRLTITYISSEFIADKEINKLKTGDYIGIYSDKPGLDVSHVGILIRENNRTFLRHASNKHCKVIDEDFQEYIKNKPGIIVLRPKD